MRRGVSDEDFGVVLAPEVEFGSEKFGIEVFGDFDVFGLDIFGDFDIKSPMKVLLCS